MSRIVTWWGTLPSTMRDVVILATAVSLGFTIASVYHRLMETPVALQAQITILRQDMDSAKVMLTTHIIGTHQGLTEQIGLAALERSEIVRRLNEASVTRCWLVRKVAPESSPPPECQR